jgi:transposase
MTRRTFTQEFKTAAIKLVTEQKYSAKQAAKDLGINQSTLLYWLKLHRRSGNAAAASQDQSLRKRVRELEALTQRLQMERDILKKAAAFFARQEGESQP